MKKTTISIVMPVKNTAQFLEECLDSIISQTRNDWELLAVNDHSTDASLDVLTRYAEKDARIKVFNNKGNGIIPALQLAYSKSSGNLITRMDSDDIMKPDKLQDLSADLEHNGEGHVALGLVKYFSEDGIRDGFARYETWLNGLIANGNNFTEIYKECVIPSPCWMMHRSDFDSCGGFNSEVYPEDYDLVFRWYQNNITCIANNKVLHLWRDYPTRTSRTDEHYADASFIEIKTNYFLKLDYNTAKNLVVWGAGKKGKFVAELLLKNNIPFQWVCDNPNKIGKDIYGQRLLSFTALNELENTQSIVTVANPKAQTEIKKFFTTKGEELITDYVLFC